MLDEVSIFIFSFSKIDECKEIKECYDKLIFIRRGFTI